MDPEMIEQPFPSEMPEPVDVRPLRRAFSWSGICFAAVLIAATVTQLLAVWLPVKLGGADNALTTSDWWFWVSMSAPMYLIAIPLGGAMLMHLPAQAPPKQSLSKKQILALIPIALCLMYAGNLIGTLLSLVLSGGQAQNAVAELAMDNHPLKIVVMVILAPLFEELLCRKWLLDRVRGYGELLSAVMSGAIFGLLHQNFFQFFYAFALGMLFSWMYLRSGRILIPILFHMGINFIGSVIAPMMLSLLDTAALESLTSGDGSLEALAAILPGYLALMLYSSVVMGLSVLGLILLIRNRRRVTWAPTAYDLPLKAALKPALLNVGMIVYMVLCTASFIWSLFA